MEITLRPYKADDVDALMEWACDEKVTRHSRLTHFPTRDDALRYLVEVAVPHPWYRAICLQGRPVGFICVDPTGLWKGLMGFALGSRYWGQGIMTAAVKMGVKAALEEIEGLERVEAVTDVENRPPQRVLEKAGFLGKECSGSLRRLRGNPLMLSCLVYCLMIFLIHCKLMLFKKL